MDEVDHVPQPLGPVLPTSEGPQVKVDRWAHRRGEPRTFAVLWLFFLMGATLITIGSAGVIGLVSTDVYRPMARVMLVLAAGGVSVLWPMTRLSQVIPHQPAKAVVVDLVVLLFPLHLMIWPQTLPWMASWTLATTAALAASCTAWSLLIGALLGSALQDVSRREFSGSAAPGASAIGHRPSAARSVWMGVFIVLAGAGVVVGLFAASGTPEASASTDGRGAWMWSPMSAVWELTADQSWTGWATVLGATHRTALVVTAGIALIAWVYVLAGTSAVETWKWKRSPR